MPVNIKPRAAMGQVNEYRVLDREVVRLVELAKQRRADTLLRGVQSLTRRSRVFLRFGTRRRGNPSTSEDGGAGGNAV